MARSYSSAITISAPTYSYAVGISQATSQSDPSPTCGNNSHEKSVWFQHTPTNDGTVVVDTIGTNFDTILSAWTGACGALTSAACDDDSGGSLTSRISMAVSAGVTYKFMVSSYRGNGGTLDFHFSYTPALHRLTLGTAGTGTGTVSASPTGTSCGAGCWDYVGAPVVSLIATPTSGSEFLGWSGDADCVDGSVTMSTNHSCVATSARPRLRLSTVGTGSGAVAANPVGAGCGANCWEYAYNNVLSANATLDASERVLGERPVPALGPGLSSGLVTTVLTVPTVAPGKYYLLVKADANGAVAESNEDDNLRSKIVYVGPDLLIKAITAPASARAGSTVSITVTTRNGGKNPTVATVTKLLCSADGKLGAGDVELGTRNVPGLAVNAVDTWTLTATILAGAPAGTRYFFAVADYFGAQSESKETNNTKKKAFTVTP